MTIEQDILKLKQMTEDSVNDNPALLDIFIEQDLPVCDLQANSLSELFIKIGEAYGCAKDEILDSAYNDDPSVGIDNSSIRERLEK